MGDAGLVRGARPARVRLGVADRDRHSANVAERPEVALAVFDSTVPVGSAIAVYVEAVAAPVNDAELADALAVFNARSVARGLRPWSESDVTGAAPHRLFRALASQVWVLDENERRVVVAWTATSTASSTGVARAIGAESS